MIYTFSKWKDAREAFKLLFGTDIRPFYDGPASVIFRKIRINIVDFDDWLHLRHGDYEDRGLSMEELVIEKYGQEASELINALL